MDLIEPLPPKRIFLNGVIAGGKEISVEALVWHVNNYRFPAVARDVREAVLAGEVGVTRTEFPAKICRVAAIQGHVESMREGRRKSKYSLRANASILGRDRLESVSWDVGLPPSPCDFVTAIGMFLDESANPIAVMKEYDWSISGPENTSAFGSVVSDSSLAQIANNGSGDFVTFTPPDDGQDHFVNIGPSFPEELVTFCDACSGGDVFVSALFDVRIRIARAVYKLATVGPNSSTYDLACPNGNQNASCGTAHLLGIGHNEPWATEFTLVVNGSCNFVNLELFNAAPRDHATESVP